MLIESQVRAVGWTALIIVILRAIILIGCHGKCVSVCLLWVKAHYNVMLCSQLQQQGDNVDFTTLVSHWFHDSKHVKFLKYALFHWFLRWQDEALSFTILGGNTKRKVCQCSLTVEMRGCESKDKAVMCSSQCMTTDTDETWCGCKIVTRQRNSFTH